MRPPRIPAHWLAVLLALASGCGHAAYEERLQKSVRFYEYLTVLDQNLSRTPWVRGDRGLSMRVPLPFSSRMPAPPPPVADVDGRLVFTPDPRHPLLLGLELEGIVDAWEAQLPDANGVPGPALLYVVTNQDRFLYQTSGSAAPSAFLDDLETALAGVFEVVIPAGEASGPTDNARYRFKTPERTSPAAAYALPRDFTAIQFVPGGPIGGQSLRGMLYEFQSGQIQGAVLCICPLTASPQFRDRLQMALNTLQIPTQVPAGTPAGGARPAGTPAGF